MLKMKAFITVRKNLLCTPLKVRRSMFDVQTALSKPLYKVP